MTRKVIAVQVPPEHQMSPWEDREPIDGLVIIHEVNLYRHITTYGKDTWMAEAIEACEEYNGRTEDPEFYKFFIDLLNERELSYENFRTIEELLEYGGDYHDDCCKVLSLLDGGKWKHVRWHDFMQIERADFYYDENKLNDMEIDGIITEYFNEGNEWEVTSYADGVEEDRLMVYCHNAEDPLLEIAWAISADPDNIELEWYEG